MDDRYGQTGAGKTHTMAGSEDQPGIIPLSVKVPRLMCVSGFPRYRHVSSMPMHHHHCGCSGSIFASSSESIQEVLDQNVYHGNLRRENVTHAPFMAGELVVVETGPDPVTSYYYIICHSFADTIC